MDSVQGIQGEVNCDSSQPGHKGYRTYLSLQIYNNPLECDSRMCWMKEAEKEGWIRYNALYDAPPDCANADKGWYYIDLNCTWSENEV